jgi:hypothetical protein
MFQIQNVAAMPITAFGLRRQLAIAPHFNVRRPHASGDAGTSAARGWMIYLWLTKFGRLHIKALQS